MVVVVVVVVAVLAVASGASRSVVVVGQSEQLWTMTIYLSSSDITEFLATSMRGWLIGSGAFRHRLVMEPLFKTRTGL